MKKSQIILIVVIALLVIGGVSAFVVLSNSSKTVAEKEEVTPAPKKKRVAAPLNVIPLEQRPVMALRPFISNGKNLEIELESLPLPADSAEYEIEYTIGSATAKTAAGRDTKVPDNEASEGLQGFIGELDLSSFPAKTEKMLGSCSAGGACIYHAGITEGKISLRFAAKESYALQSVFTYFEEGAQSNPSIDGKFTLAGSGLTKTTDFLIVEMMGLPAGLPGKIVLAGHESEANWQQARAYGVYFSKSMAASTEVTATFADAPAGSQIAAYSAGEWTLLESKVSGKELSATGTLAEIYALIMPS